MIAALESLPHVTPPGDLSSSFDSFARAVERFGDQIARIGWGYLAAALALSLALQLCRGHAWSNALRAAFPDSKFAERRVIGAFLVGAGMNGVLPAKGGDALKIVLAKRNVPGSSYPAIISSFAVLAPFDTAIGLVVLGYAITQGLLPGLPRIPDLPAFEISFWVDNPIALVLLLALLTVGAIYLARRAERFLERFKQGIAILRQPRRYAREVLAWQATGWLARFASFWLFLEAFHIGGSFENVLLVMSVQAVAGALPFTPGGAGAQQALLVATLQGPGRGAVLAYSVGQQAAVTVFSVAVAFLVLLVIFRSRDWRRMMREGRDAATAETRAAADAG